MATPGDQASPLEWAMYYRSRGLVVIPARDKRPAIKWREHEDRHPTEEEIVKWFTGETFRGRLQAYVVCGQISGVVVLDCDSPEAEEWWSEVLGEVMQTTARSLSGSGRGHHYWFTLGEQPVKGRSRNKGAMKWDLRGEGGGVVVPPSRHESGEPYVWELDLDHIKPWPYPEALDRPDTQDREGSIQSEGSSSLAWLLANPGDGGRNNWVTKVLGHYAKALRYEDGYRQTAEMVWAMVSAIPNPDPYERDEFDRTVESVWATEHGKWNGAAKPDSQSGYLSGDGSRLYALCTDKDTGEFLQPWAEFDIKAKRRVTDEHNVSTYLVDVTRHLGSGVDILHDVVLPADILGTNDSLNRWLAGRLLMVTNSPKGDLGFKMSKGARLQQYIQSQNPLEIRTAPWMGWYDDDRLGSVYVCSQGVIDADGLHTSEEANLIPNPSKVKSGGGTEWYYGFDGSREQAQAVLREVLTYHDPVVTSTFGAMWALAPIKGAMMEAASLFPHIALIAPSEAGKTNGFFDLMLQSNGRLSVGGTYTPASLRDDLARHRGGFVWIDDPANVDDLGDLLRAAAGEGVHSRKGGQNWSEVIHTSLVAPLVISAEGMEMLRERAMADRTVQLEVPSPVGRESRRGNYPQWDDIVSLTQRLGHLGRFAGHYVQGAFEWLRSIGGTDGLHRLLLELRVGTGRQAEKTAIVRAGARCLAYIAGVSVDGEHGWTDLSVDGLMVGGADPIDLVGIVDSWAEGHSTQVRPYLIEVVLPTFLANRGFVPNYRSVPVEPVWIASDGCLRVSVNGLATWWQRFAASRTDKERAQQLGSKSAMLSEAQMMDLQMAAPVKGKRYRIVSAAISREVLTSAGFEYDDLTGEVADQQGWGHLTDGQ